jgi:hypothetical protein
MSLPHPREAVVEAEAAETETTEAVEAVGEDKDRSMIYETVLDRIKPLQQQTPASDDHLEAVPVLA